MAKLKSKQCSTGHGTGVTPYVDLRTRLGSRGTRLSLGNAAESKPSKARRRLEDMLFGRQCRTKAERERRAAVRAENAAAISRW